EAKLRASSCTIELATKKKEFDELSVKMLATTDELELAREAERELGVLMAQIKLELEAKRVALDEEMVVSEAYQKGEQRLDLVAGGLKAIATESISDVGGLFDKLARKTKVLGSNADGATRFGANMQGLSNDLRGGLQQLNSVQGAFSRDLQAELEMYGRRGLEESQRDMANLEASFTAFNTMAKHFAKSIERGQSSASQASASLLAMKNEVQVSVREWASGVSEKSTRMVEDLLEHQQEHLSMVGSVLDSTADLVDAVISTARDHLAVEAQSSVRLNQLTSDTANAEIARLRHQNILLTKLLEDEKAKTSKLRTDLVTNLTSMIVSFTDAQDASWSEAVAQVQSANDAGTLEMERFADVSTELCTANSVRANACMGELDMGAQTSVMQRGAGHEAVQSVKNGLKSRLEDYGRETVVGAGEHVEVVDGFCGRMGSAADDVQVGSQASARAKEQSKLLHSMSKNTGETYTSARTRTTAVAASVDSLSATLLKSHASSSEAFNEIHSTATSSLTSLIDRTDSFLVKGIQEDLPTGITPRKRVWNVDSSWERTEPRDVLLASLRQRANRIEHFVSPVSPESESIEQSELPAGLPRANSTEHVGEFERSREVNELVSSQMGKGGKVVPVAVPVSVAVPVLLGKKGFGFSGVGVAQDRPALTVLGEGGANVPRRARR
ncbi:MAG: kinesin motor protein cin8, partial [Tremellales sp. Tagirdzhanova-0007]